MILPSVNNTGLRRYAKPRVLVMLALGFSSGMPFLLTANTFGYWLRDDGVSLSVIAFISWVGIVYSIKFLWAPFLDRTIPPVAGRLGHRRAWMLVSQVVIAAGLFSMAGFQVRQGLPLLVGLAFVVAFASATQDIVIDAWRIEIADSGEELALLTSAHQFGYRVAFLGTDALILIAAEYFGWPLSYAVCAALMTIGIGATLLATEPAKADAVIEQKAHDRPFGTARGLGDAIAGPFLVFFRSYGWIAVPVLMAISLYRLPDFVRGPMSNPFYADIGLSKAYVGEVRGTIGVAMTFLGIAAGGAFALRFGYIKALIAGGVLQAIAIASFAMLAHRHPGGLIFATIMSLDNFSTNFAGVALVSYMSSLTALGYTATQYALLSSMYALPGKITKGLSGLFVQHLAVSYGLMGAYKIFFIGAGAVGIPAILLFMALSARQPAARGVGS